ncbi:MAG: mechanosensitive ion channel [Phyllobacteriaceae bacterium]|nr:mechanosensitive ion channel [Phyllobacteriaceae bacterium]
METFQRQSVILPNSDLINQAVGNWTHRNMLARVDIMVGVGYTSDVTKVQFILRDVADKQPGVLKSPEPFVLFKDFGASSLDFELRVFVADLFEQLRIQSEIRFEIIRRFREEGIEVPFPQRDVKLKFDDGGASLPAALRKVIEEKQQQGEAPPSEQPFSPGSVSSDSNGNEQGQTRPRRNKAPNAARKAAPVPEKGT